MPTSQLTQSDIDRVLQVALGKDPNPLTAEERARYNITRTTPNVLDVTALTQRLHQIPGKTLEQHSPAVHGAIPQPPAEGLPGGYQPGTFQGGDYQPVHQPEMMSLDEMMRMINNRMDLYYDPQISQLNRTLEQNELAAKQRIGETEAAYEEGMHRIQKGGEQHQRQMAELTGRRGIYDSGLATHIADRIQGEYGKMGFDLTREQSRVLADIAEFVHLQKSQTNEQIQEMMGERGQMAQAMLDEMHMAQQSRQDDLNQKNFLNMLEQMRNDADLFYRNEEQKRLAQSQGWEQGFRLREFNAQEAQRAWERVFSQNSHQDRMELDNMLARNQISQQEFTNAMALDEYNLKVKLYEWQSRVPY